MIARLESVALIGLCLGLLVLFLGWLTRRRSARDRSALWAIGLASILVASAAGLVVRPQRFTLRVPRALAGQNDRAVPRLPVPPPGSILWFSPAAGRQVPPAPGTPPPSELLALVWLLVAGALLARWTSGYLAAAAVLRKSQPLPAALAARIGRLLKGAASPVRLHAGIPVPLTVSLLRSTVLLPLGALGWRDERLVAVLAHELAHVSRLDGPVRSMAGLCAALHWFNPLVWIAASRLEADQEVAADDAILEAGWLPSCYARELLALAEALDAGRATPRLALRMVRRSGLMARLSLILGPERRYSFSPRPVAAFAVGLAALGAVAVAFRPVLSFAEPVGAAQSVIASLRAEDGGYVAVPGTGSALGAAGGIGDGSVSIAVGQTRPGAIAADAANVYWLNFEGGTVMKLPRSGGEAIVLATGQGGPQSIAVDSERLYWSDFAAGTIESVPIAGGRIEKLATGQDRPSGITVDARQVYWVTRDGSLWSAPLSGGDADRLVAGEGSAEIETRSLVSDGAYLYWTDPGDISASRGRILRYDLSGRRVAVLADRQDSPCRLAVDGTNVYWTNLGTRANRLTDGTVMQVPRQGGSPVVLASGQLQPLGISVDGGVLYWTGAPLEHPADGIVMKLPLAGGKAAVAASQQRRPAGLALKAGAVYWTDAEDGTVRSLLE